MLKRSVQREVWWVENSFKSSVQVWDRSDRGSISFSLGRHLVFILPISVSTKYRQKIGETWVNRVSEENTGLFLMTHLDYWWRERSSTSSPSGKNRKSAKKNFCLTLHVLVESVLPTSTVGGGLLSPPVLLVHRCTLHQHYWCTDAPSTSSRGGEAWLKIVNMSVFWIV